MNYVLIVGALVFIVQVIVQIFKELPGLRKLPTDLLVVILSVALTELAVGLWPTYDPNVQLQWFYWVGGVLGGFVVAYIAMYGWGRLKDLWERSHKST